ncbi:hypothetical protein BHE74_00015819 [Ensete ventricosum]|nr:hypothetical protein BHE74_00015819 [Ensete ventricosum]
MLGTSRKKRELQMVIGTQLLVLKGRRPMKIIIGVIIQKTVKISQFKVDIKLTAGMLLFYLLHNQEQNILAKLAVGKEQRILGLVSGSIDSQLIQKIGNKEDPSKVKMINGMDENHLVKNLGKVIRLTDGADLEKGVMGSVEEEAEDKIAGTVVAVINKWIMLVIKHLVGEEEGEEIMRLMVIIDANGTSREILVKTGDLVG